jgi:hypothetical protein
MFSEEKSREDRSREEKMNELNEEMKNVEKGNSQLKSLKYKNIGLSWNNNRKNTANLDNLEAMLETERNDNDKETWSKLNKTIKIKKLLRYADKYKEENNLSVEDHEKLIIFFKDCLDKKKLQRVKDVEYDRETGEIISISSLIHNKNSHHFTLKNIYKKVSTIKNLPQRRATLEIVEPIVISMEDDGTNPKLNDDTKID